MSENFKSQSLTYSLGLVHGTKNVLSRMLKTINNQSPIIGGKLIAEFAKLLGLLNNTESIKENGKFVVNDRAEIIFEWIPERWESIRNEINADL